MHKGLTEYFLYKYHYCKLSCFLQNYIEFFCKSKHNIGLNFKENINFTTPSSYSHNNGLL